MGPGIRPLLLALLFAQLKLATLLNHSHITTNQASKSTFNHLPDGHCSTMAVAFTSLSHSRSQMNKIIFSLSQRSSCFGSLMRKLAIQLHATPKLAMWASRKLTCGKLAKNVTRRHKLLYNSNSQRPLSSSCFLNVFATLACLESPTLRDNCRAKLGRQLGLNSTRFVIVVAVIVVVSYNTFFSSKCVVILSQTRSSFAAVQKLTCLYYAALSFQLWMLKTHLQSEL